MTEAKTPISGTIKSVASDVGKKSGKRYWTIYLEGDEMKYLAFDPTFANAMAVGQAGHGEYRDGENCRFLDSWIPESIGEPKSESLSQALSDRLNHIELRLDTIDFKLKELMGSRGPRESTHSSAQETYPVIAVPPQGWTPKTIGLAWQTLCTFHGIEEVDWRPLLVEFANCELAGGADNYGEWSDLSKEEYPRLGAALLNTEVTREFFAMIAERKGT